MSLPNNLYYPIIKAAKSLDCDIADIIHWAANGFIKLCVKVYSPGAGFGKVNDEWSSYLLVNYNAVNGTVSPDDLVTDERDGGEKLSVYSQGFDYVNSYVRVVGSVDFWLEEQSLQVVDSCTAIHGVYGLLQVDERDLYIHEMDLMNNGSISVSSFTLPSDITNEKLSGYFRRNDDSINTCQIISIDDDYLRSNGIENSLSHDGFIITLDSLFITRDEFLRLKGEIAISQSVVSKDDKPEDPKTAAKKAEIIPVLIKLLPDFNDVDIDLMAVSKIQSLIESIAAKQGVELPDTHVQTWQKYLGRGRSKR
jgi:hypothetical protein